MAMTLNVVSGYGSRLLLSRYCGPPDTRRTIIVNTLRTPSMTSGEEMAASATGTLALATHFFAWQHLRHHHLYVSQLIAGTLPHYM
jgi:hypothetical protein